MPQLRWRAVAASASRDVTLAEKGEPGAVATPTGGRLRARIGPIAVGFLLDLVDLATFGPAGLYGGFVLAGAAGWWLGREVGLATRGRLALAILAAAYSALPATEFVPVGTLVGAAVRLLRRD